MSRKNALKHVTARDMNGEAVCSFTCPACALKQGRAAELALSLWRAALLRRNFAEFQSAARRLRTALDAARAKGIKDLPSDAWISLDGVSDAMDRAADQLRGLVQKRRRS